MVASCFELIGIGQQGLCHSGCRGAPVDGICVCCGKHTVGRALHGVCSVAAGAAGVGVAGATAVGDLTTWVAGAGVDAAGATLPMLDVSGLTASK